MAEPEKSISIIKIMMITFLMGLILTGIAYFLLLRLEDRLVERSLAVFEEKIKTVYSEEEIKQIVGLLIDQKIKETIAEAVKQEIAPVISDMEQQRNNYESGLAKLNEKQASYSEVNDLNQVTILAENGDRKAFDTLKEMAVAKDNPYAKLAEQNVLRIFVKFIPNQNKKEYYNEKVTDEEVISMLSSPNILNRRIAVKTVAQRKMADQISTLIIKLAVEDNLEILAAIYMVLNELLGTDISMLQPDAGRLFVEAWSKYKETAVSNNKTATESNTTLPQK